MTALAVWPRAAVLVLLVGVGALLAAAGLGAPRRGWRSRRWPSVDGVVERAELSERLGLDGDSTTVAELRYDYEVGGRRYRGDRASFGLGTGSAVARSALRGLTPRGPVKVFYDPEAPSQSVLRPGIPLTAVFLVLAGLVRVAGAGIALFVP